jgi:hypothetical protein
MKPPIGGEAIRRKAIRWWLGPVLFVAGMLGLLDDWSLGPKWSQTDTRWFWPGMITAFGLAGLIVQRGFSLGLVTITVIGVALLVWQPWFWFVSLGLVGLFIAFEQRLTKRFPPRKPEQPTSEAEAENQ